MFCEGGYKYTVFVSKLNNSNQSLNHKIKNMNDRKFIRTTLNEWNLSKWYDRFIGK